MQRIKVKESYRLDAEALKYDLVITNKQIHKTAPHMIC